MMKKLLSLAALFFLAATLSACSTSPQEQPPPPATTRPTDAIETALPTPTVDLPVRTSTPGPTSTPASTSTPTLVPPFQDVSVMGMDLTGTNYNSIARLAADAGAHWARSDGVRWADIEPSPGERRWESQADFESFSLALSENGLHHITIVKDTPGWAQGVPPYACGPIAADALDDFGNFMFDLVARYSVAPYNLKYWELGNEPDAAYRFVPPDSPFGCWGEHGEAYYGGRYYAEMLKAVYPRIKAADPEAQVLIGGLLLDCDPYNPPVTNRDTGEKKDCSPGLFLEGVLENGGGDYFDGVSFHAYDFYDSATGLFLNFNWNGGVFEQDLVPVIVTKTQFLRNILSKYGRLDKYLVNTETALLCGRDGNESFCLSDRFRTMKADYVGMSYASAVAVGLRGNLWYTLQETWRRSYLAPGGVPEKGYYAFRYAAERHTGAAYWGLVHEFDDVHGYKFKKEGREYWVIWSLTGAPVSLSFDELPESLYSVTGEPIPPTQTIELSASPVYVDWAP